VQVAWLWPLAALFVAAPPALAFLVDRQAKAFQAEAFGHLRRAARNLRIMGAAILAYYTIVILGAWYTGDLRLLVEPPTREGILLYVRIGAASVGYAFGYFVARELYLVVRPPHHGRGAQS
jgi:hypothetical protein